MVVLIFRSVIVKLQLMCKSDDTADNLIEGKSCIDEEAEIAFAEQNRVLDPFGYISTIHET